MAYSLDQVIKRFKSIIKDINNNDTQKYYYECIVKYLKIENKYKDVVEKSNKKIYHYFQYHLPVSGNDYFMFLYNPYNPVRFAIETFDSIEEIKHEINKS